MSNRYYIPDESAPDTTLALLQQIARLSRNETASELKATGLYPGQEGVIGALAALGTATPGAIAKRLGVRPPTITKTLTRLQEQGFVTRVQSDLDRRQVTVALTKSGEDVVKSMNKAIKRVEKHALSGLKKKERKQLQKLLETVRAQIK